MKTTQARNPRDSGKLASLSRSVSERDCKLDAFNAPLGLSEVHLEIEHMTSLCPATGAEDFYSIDISYAPRGLCLETRSLKEYFASFRSAAVSAEVLADQIAQELLEASGAQWMKATVHQAVRGGIRIHATAHLSVNDGEQRPVQERNA
jgi:7-cyano-7-deazaguanine reductase